MVRIRNTISAGNTVTGSQAPECRDVCGVTSEGYNLIGAATDTDPNNGQSPGTFTSSDLLNVDPMFSSAGLADNGGPTQTISLQPGSPAIDQANSDRTTDQRGFPRPVDLASQNASGGDGSDIGAFEVRANEQLDGDGHLPFDRSNAQHSQYTTSRRGV